jgi:hypothetical protein
MRNTDYKVVFAYAIVLLMLEEDVTCLKDSIVFSKPASIFKRLLPASMLKNIPAVSPNIAAELSNLVHTTRNEETL